MAADASRSHEGFLGKKSPKKGAGYQKRWCVVGRPQCRQLIRTRPLCSSRCGVESLQSVNPGIRPPVRPHPQCMRETRDQPTPIVICRHCTQSATARMVQQRPLEGRQQDYELELVRHEHLRHVGLP